MNEREEYTRGPLAVRIVEKPHYLGGKHLQYYIETVADHSQSKAPNPVLGIAQGLPEKEGDPVVPVLWLRKPDAHLFAAAPDLLETAEDAHEILDVAIELWNKLHPDEPDEVFTDLQRRFREAASKARPQS